MDEALGNCTISTLLQGETAFPRANLALSLAKRIAAEPALAEALYNVIGELSGDVESMHAACRRIAENPESSPALLATTKDTEAVLNRWQGALEAVAKAVGSAQGAEMTPEGASTLEAAAEELQQASSDLDRLASAVRDIADREGRVPCVRCGHWSRPDRPLCEACGARLPRVAELRAQNVDVLAEDGGLPEPEPQMTENLARLLELASAAAADAGARAALESEVTQMEALLAEAKVDAEIDNPRAALRTPAQWEAFERTRALYRQAIADCEMGLSMLRQFAHNGGNHRLDAAGHLLCQGAANMQRVQHRLEELSGVHPSAVVEATPATAASAEIGMESWEA